MRAGPWASRAAALERDAADRLCGRLGAVEIDVEHGNLGAETGQVLCDRGADAGAAAGHQGGLRRDLHPSALSEGR